MALKAHEYNLETFKTVTALLDHAMANQELSDIDRLMIIFDHSKEDVKIKEPNLYYCLLTIADDIKMGFRFEKRTTPHPKVFANRIVDVPSFYQWINIEYGLVKKQYKELEYSEKILMRSKYNKEYNITGGNEI